MNIIKKLIPLVALAFLANNTYACDEACEKAKLVEKNVSFPSYVTWSYCDDIREEFMTTTLRSVGTYLTEKMNTKYMGNVRNTKQFLADRKSWVQECDNYLQATNQDPIFETKEKTAKIYAMVDSVLTEFDKVLAGVTRSGAAEGKKTFIVEKYEVLFKAVDDHRNLMHLRGKYVYR